MLRDRVASALADIRFSGEANSRVAEIVTLLIEAQTAAMLRRFLVEPSTGDSPTDVQCAGGPAADADAPGTRSAPKKKKARNGGKRGRSK